MPEIPVPTLENLFAVVTYLAMCCNKILKEIEDDGTVDPECLTDCYLATNHLLATIVKLCTVIPPQELTKK